MNRVKTHATVVFRVDSLEMRGLCFLYTAQDDAHDRPKDLRELIDREPIAAELTEEPKKAAAAEPAAVPEEPDGWWVEWMKTLDEKSKSRLRLDNRLVLEHAYPEINGLHDASEAA